nr:MAG TPA: hypothetical protein [Caudoviricetes sp.]
MRTNNSLGFNHGIILYYFFLLSQPSRLSFQITLW